MKNLNDLIDAVKNYKEQFPEDVLCFGQSDLLEFIPYEHVKDLVNDDVTEEAWNKDITQPTEENIRKKIISYMDFAIGKAEDHRGLSAGRSINHFQTWTWILGDYDKIDWKNYANYGAPILKQLCELYSISFPDIGAISRMADGEKCTGDCQEGCSA